jgi:putative polymerase
MLVAGLLLAFRLLPLPTLRWLVPLFPFVLFAALVGVGWLLPPGEDNVLGRMGMSGRALLAFDSARLMGLDGQLPMYGDMGYAYVLSRFGTLQVIGLLLVLFLIPCTSARAERFRALLVVYFFCSLAISGTSAFALKTAGLMWFLWGTLSADPRLDLRRLKPGKRAHP